ncbi:MAG: methyltransferase domain-containing protein [Thermoleophilia bacterium]
MSDYDAIAWLYDDWSRTVREDVSFYIEEALASGGPVVELGVGTGRIGIPVALSGVHVIGVDASQGMLDVCRSTADAAGVDEFLDLRLGDYRDPPVDERVPLVMVPFRAYLHLLEDDDRVRALTAARELLLPGGKLIFDVFAPSPEDIRETHGRWLEREPGIFERADWDAARQRLVLSVRGEEGEASMELAWLGPDAWRDLLERTGFEVLGLYEWFDRRPYRGGEDQVWIARRPP